MKIQVVFYSMYGHIHLMAEAVAAGASTGADQQSLSAVHQQEWRTK